MNQQRFLFAFHTTEGQTEKIANRIAEVLRGDGASVDVHTAASVPVPEGYDSVVVGGSIHAGKHGSALSDYITTNAAALNAMPSALFGTRSSTSHGTSRPSSLRRAGLRQSSGDLMTDTPRLELALDECARPRYGERSDG